MPPASTPPAETAVTIPSGAPVRRPWYDPGFHFTPRQALTLLALLVIGVAASFALDWALSHFIEPDAEQIQRWVDRFGPVAPLAFIILEAVTVIFTPLPSVPVDIAGGLAFGWLLGTLYTLTGAMLGATIDFLLARRLGRRFLAGKLGSKAMREVDAIAEQMGAKLIFLMRLLPLFNFKWVSYGAGLTRIRYRTYAIFSLLGTLLPTLAIVYVGDVLLTHPGRSALVFSGLVAWSAVPPVLFLLWAGSRALMRRLRGAPASPLATAAPLAAEPEALP